MKKSLFTDLLVSAAVAGLLSGSVAIAQDKQDPKKTDKSPKPTKTVSKEASKAKDSCKGKDGCSGKDSTQVKSKDSCKGKDGCKGVDKKKKDGTA